MVRLLILASVCSSHLIAADYAQVGGLSKDGNWEVSLIYEPTVDRSTALSVDKYRLPAEAQINEVREQPLDNGIILSVSGLLTNRTYSVNITNIQSTAGAVLPTVQLSFTAQPLSWAAIGTQELGLPAEVLAVGTNGFDIVSGGVEMFGTYDESTFVYEPITGDFDRRVRVVQQEDSSFEARAGLMVREVLDERKPRPIDPEDPAQGFSRYLQIHVNPVRTAYEDIDGTPIPARNEFQINFRPLPGGRTENPPMDTNAPAYPNAWLRLKRVGETFFVFRGTDGTNWVQLGRFNFPTVDPDGKPVAPFGKSVFVGPNYSPEVGNIPEISGKRRAFLAKFRDYSEAFGDVQVEDPELSVVRNGNDVAIVFAGGTLQTTTNVVGNAWSDLGTTSPLTIRPDKRYQFFRLRIP